MKPKILFFDIRGLNNFSKINRLKKFIRFFYTLCSIIFLQEYILSKINAKKLSQKLWKDVKFYILKVSLRFNYLKDKVKKGRIFVLINSSSMNLFFLIRLYLDNRIWWLIFKSQLIKKIDIANIYVNKRTIFFFNLQKIFYFFIPNNLKWILRE